MLERNVQQDMAESVGAQTAFLKIRLRPKVCVKVAMSKALYLSPRVLVYSNGIHCF